MMRSLVSLCCLSVLCSVARADDWPQFLGPQRTGVSKERALLQQWPEGGPKQLWRVPCVGGLSGVAVVGEVAFTMTQEVDQAVTAYEARTGKRLWNTSIAPAYKNQMGNGPRATPTVVDGAVYAFTGDGVLAAIEAKSGRLRWKNPVVKELGGKPAEYGMASSPLVNQGLVIVAAGVEGAALVACDAATGTIRWKAGSDTAGYSSPVVGTLNGVQQCIAFTGNSVCGYSLDDGSRLWSYRFVTDYECNIAVPVIVGELVLISAGENHGSVLLKPGKNEVAEIWKSFGKSSSLRAEWQTPVRIGDYLYALDNQGSAGPITNLNCVEIKSGKRVWQQRRFGKSNMTLADRRLWFTTMKGEVVLVQPGPDAFKELGRKRYLEMTRQAPAIANGRLFLRDEQELLCLDIRAKK